MKRVFSPVLAGCLVIIAGCGGGNGPFDTGDECNVTEQNSQIQGIMDAWYLAYDQLPNISPASYNSPSAYLDALVEDVDFLLDDPVETAADRYSFVVTQDQEDDLIGAAFVGFGFSFRIVNDDEVQFAQVFGEYDEENLKTPASRAGFKRGYKILEIEGVPVAEIIADDPDNPVAAISEALGERTVGVTRIITYGDSDGNLIDDVTVVKEDLVFNTVARYTVFDSGATRTGYLNFRSFASPSPDELAAAFQIFNAARATDLIIDLRYNSGGLVSVAEYLANLLQGIPAEGEVSFGEVYNDKLSNRNVTFRFAREADSLATINKLVFITTPTTASASELVLNAMLPYVENGRLGDVAVVGSSSFGKPVGSLGFDVCNDLVLRPVTFQTVNAEGEGDYYDGFDPDCPAEDDLDFGFGDPREDSLAAALSYVETGACPVVTAQKLDALQAKAEKQRTEARQRGWGEILRDYH